MSKNTATLVKKITENVSKIKDDEFLTALLIMVSKAAKDPIGTKAAILATPTKKAPKVPMKAPTPMATESHILEYEFGGKKMLAFQANGKPSNEVLDLCKGAKMRFYKNVPSNPFNNALPFWAGKASDELKNALLAVA
jgi:hypothetical protein